MIQVTLKHRKLYTLIGLLLVISIIISLIVFSALNRQRPHTKYNRQQQEQPVLPGMQHPHL